MVDEDIRRLERVARAGDPAACIRTAWRLERDGQRGEAARLLRSVSEDPAAREALAKHPAWGHEDGDAGGTRALDVEPVVKRPRLLFRKRLEDGPPDDPGAVRLVASPLAVVCQSYNGLTAFDPLSGAKLWHHRLRKKKRDSDEDDLDDLDAPDAPLLVIQGEHLVVHRPGVVERRDVTTGEKVTSVKVPLVERSFPRLERAFLEGSSLYTIENAHVVARAVGPDGDGKEVWRTKETLGPHAHLRGAAGGLVFAFGGAGLVAFDKETGAKRWTARTIERFFLADEGGVVASEGDAPQRPELRELVLRGPDGKALHGREGSLAPRALAKDFVVAQAPPMGEDAGSSAVAIDRSSHESVVLPVSARGGTVPFAVARDVIYGSSGGGVVGGLVACRRDGTLLWAMSGPEVGAPGDDDDSEEWALAVVDRLIYVLVGGSLLAAFTDLPAEKKPKKKAAATES